MAAAELLLIIDEMPPEIFNFCLFALAWFVWAITHVDVRKVLQDVGYTTDEQNLEANYAGSFDRDVFAHHFVQPSAEFVHDIFGTGRRGDT